MVPSLAWEAFGEANGATSLVEMRTRIEKYRKATAQPREDYTIGCILLEQPFFLPEDLWIPAPPDWHPNIVQGKTYDLHAEVGRALWGQVGAAIRARGLAGEWPAEWREPDQPRYGEPTLELEVSRRIREDFENGRHYHALHGEAVRAPAAPVHPPSAGFLRWHDEQALLG